MLRQGPAKLGGVVASLLRLEIEGLSSLPASSARRLSSSFACFAAATTAPAGFCAQHGWSLRSFTSTAAASPGASPGAVKEFRLAQTGEGILECELLQWYVAEGDAIEEFGRVCEVQSDKATIEITSPFSGTIHRLCHSPGDTVPVGGVLAEILAPPSSYALNAPGEAEAPLSPTAAPSQINRGKNAVKTSPATRLLAKELGINLETVTASGSSGRVTRGDVMAFADSQRPPTTDDSPPTAPSTATAAAGPTTYPPLSETVAKASVAAAAAASEPILIPLRGYRKAMLKSMTAAGQIPHFHYCEEVLADTLVDLRARLQGSSSLNGAKLTFLPFFIKAAAVALAEYPTLNSSLAPAGDALLQHSLINIGIAVATPLGLVVPNVKDVASRSIAAIAQELARLQAAAMANQLRPDDLGGATFTVSNIGTVGGTYATPLVNPPEVAIMALGKIQRLPRFAADGASVVPAHVLNISLGADHRVVDGAALAGFARTLKTLVEDPAKLLLQLR